MASVHYHADNKLPVITVVSLPLKFIVDKLDVLILHDKVLLIFHSVTGGNMNMAATVVVLHTEYNTYFGAVLCSG